jgi:hypothetical protein
MQDGWGRAFVRGDGGDYPCCDVRAPGIILRRDLGVVPKPKKMRGSLT